MKRDQKITIYTTEDVIEGLDEITDNRSGFIHDLMLVVLDEMDEEIQTLAARRRVLETHKTALHKEVDELQRQIDLIDGVLKEVDEELGTAKSLWEYHIEDQYRFKQNKRYKPLEHIDELWDQIVEGKEPDAEESEESS